MKKDNFRKLNEIERIITKFAEFYHENFEDVTTSDMQGFAYVEARKIMEYL